MMLLVPVLGFSQRDAQGGLSKEEQQKSSAEIYLSMALTENQGRVSVKLDFGKTISEIITDKMILVEIEELSKMRFDSVIEAMNTLASYGWELEESYTFETRTGALTFIVFAKEVDRLKRATVGPSTKPSIQSKGGKTPAKK